jgi:hypothetical protein
MASCGSNVAPIFLRLALGLTFLWAGWNKVFNQIEVQGEPAAILANLGVISPPAPGVTPAPNTLPVPSDLAPARPVVVPTLPPAARPRRSPNEPPQPTRTEPAPTEPAPTEPPQPSQPKPSQPKPNRPRPSPSPRMILPILLNRPRHASWPPPPQARPPSRILPSS